jgi:hypothetical protein
MLYYSVISHSTILGLQQDSPGFTKTRMFRVVRTSGLVSGHSDQADELAGAARRRKRTYIGSRGELASPTLFTSIWFIAEWGRPLR